MKGLRLGLLVILLAGASRSAFADVIDEVGYLTRVNARGHSVEEVCGLVLALAAINYVWNLLVIGLPCLRLCAVGRKRLLLDVGLITVLGQAADRLGAVISYALARLLASLLSFSLDGFVLLVVLANFVCSGAAIGCLVWFFVRKKWGGSSRAALVMAIVAAIATNPMLGLYLSLGKELPPPELMRLLQAPPP
ncbi:MAG: hypothetical protein ACLQGV_06250 [Bryobacteraceae bacterium]